MFWCDEVDIVYLASLLQFHHPICQLFWGRVKAFSLVGDVTTLAEDTAQIVPREKDATAAVVAL